MNEINVNFKDGVVDDGYMWVFDNALQAVCKINLETMIMDIVDRYEGAKEITVGWIVQWEHMLYMVQIESPGILIYDRNKKCFYERFDVPEIGYGKPKVSTVLLYEDMLWIFPLWLENDACCYDLKKGKFYIDKNITGLLRQHKSSLGVFSPFYCMENNILWLVCFGGNVYWKYDLKNGNSEKYEFNDSEMQLSGICCEAGKKWFTFINSGRVMLSNDEGNCMFWDKAGSENRPFSNIVNIGFYTLLMPRYANNIAVIDTKNNEMRRIELKKDEIRTSGNERVRNFCKYGDKLYLIPYQSGEMYKVDGATGEVKREELTTSFHYELEQVMKKLNKGEVLRENENMGIRGFIAYCNEV